MKADSQSTGFAVLMENTAQPGFLCEHGFSLLIHHKGLNILLDAGSSGAFAKNALDLSLDLAKVDLAVLSHGHYDHSDGFREFFPRNHTAPLYLRPEALGEQFSSSSLTPGGQIMPMDATPTTPKFAGVHREIPLHWQERFVFSPPGLAALQDWSEDLFLLAHQPEQQVLQSNLLVKRAWDDFIPDDFAHQQSLLLKTQDRLLLFNSCCHGSAVAVLRQVREHFPSLPVVLVGGLHLMGMEPSQEQEIRALGEELITLGIIDLYTGHCTGEFALDVLAQVLGDRLHPLSAGDVVKL